MLSRIRQATAVAFALRVSAGLSLVGLFPLPAYGLEASSPTLITSAKGPDATTVFLYQVFVKWSERFYGKPTSGTATLYYMIAEDPARHQRRRVWEESYLFDVRAEPFFRPKGFSLHFADVESSCVVLLYWDQTELRVSLLNPRRAHPARFEQFYRNLEGKEVSTVDPKIAPPRGPWDVYPSVRFKVLLPGYAWDPVAGNPPKIGKVWREADSWNIQIAVGQPEMHLRLADGAKEWV